MKNQEPGKNLFCLFGDCEGLALFGDYCKDHQLQRAESAEARVAQLETKLHELEIPCNKCNGSGFVYDNVCGYCSGGSIGYATPKDIAQLEAERDELRRQLEQLTHKVMTTPKYLDEALNSGKGVYRP